jgi:hypothetical protein
MFSLSSALGPGARGASILGTALDAKGRFYVLTNAGRQGAERELIVSFDNEGNHQESVVLEPAKIRVDAFAVFVTGDILLVGDRPGRTGPGVAIRPADGGLLREVWLSDGVDAGLFSAAASGATIHAESSWDGRVYLAGNTGRVYAVSASGDVDARVELGRAPVTGARLVGIRLSGQRLAAIYAEQRPGPMASSVYWATVHDTMTGEPVASYGPMAHAVACYRATTGSPDQFTLYTRLEGRLRLLHAQSPR